MKNTGIVRNVDDLGRLVLPREFRKHLGIENGTPVEITSEDDKIVIRKFNPRCVFCNGTGEGAPLVEFNGKKVCAECRAKISAF